MIAKDAAFGHRTVLLAGRAQELYTYDEYGAFADDEGIDERLRAEVADALGEKYVEELDI